MLKKLWVLLGIIMIIGVAVGCSTALKEATDKEKPANVKKDGNNTGKEAETKLDFPKSDIKVIIPFNAGGGTDIQGRLFLTALSKEIEGVNLVPMNVGGAGGTVGANELYNSEADGYTLMVAHAGFPVPYILGNFDKTYNDFKHVNQFAESYMALYVAEDSPYQTLEDLVGAAKATPGELVFGVSNNTLLHFATLSVEKQNDITFKKVAIGGSTPKPPELISGRIEGYIGSISEGKPYIDSGDFRALAVFAEERLDIISDVPTFKELEYPYDFLQTWGIWAPKDVPDEIIEYVSAAAEKACQDPEFIEKMTKLGSVVKYSDSYGYERILAQTFRECEDVSSLLK